MKRQQILRNVCLNVKSWLLAPEKHVLSRDNEHDHELFAFLQVLHLNDWVLGWCNQKVRRYRTTRAHVHVMSAGYRSHVRIQRA